MSAYSVLAAFLVAVVDPLPVVEESLAPQSYYASEGFDRIVGKGHQPVGQVTAFPH
jgi:hypothetical protein